MSGAEDAVRDARAVLGAFGVDPAASVDPIDAGLVNKSFEVRDAGGRYVLQRLHAVFDAPALMRDVAWVTGTLAAAGLPTPRCVPAPDGRALVARDGAWRLMTWVPGRTWARLPTPDHAFEAAALAARFHRALGGRERPFEHRLAGFHDTPAILAHLAVVAAAAPGGPVGDEVRALARRIGSSAEALPVRWPGLPRRVVHADLKASNVRFDEAGDRAVCLLDLDTVMHAPLAVELGDAARSWCSTASAEDDPRAEVDDRVFAALAAGYARDAPPDVAPEERGTAADGFAAIALELAARFAADAVEDRYFGWDPSRYGSRAEHDLARARGQLALAEDALRRMPDLRRTARVA